jgi:hypothetical protein
LPTGPCGELANRLLSDLLKFEAIAAKVAVRRALVTSQVRLRSIPFVDHLWANFYDVEPFILRELTLLHMCTARL